MMHKESRLGWLALLGLVPTGDRAISDHGALVN